MAAACVLLVFGSFTILNSNFGNKLKIDEDSSSVSGNMNNNAGQASTESIKTAPFKNIDWYNDSLTNESVPKALAQKLESSLDYLSYGSENKFINAEKADAEKTEQIIMLLSSADESSEEITGTKLYYMAVFTDGTVAKFSITNEKYIEISGDEKKYKNYEN